MDPAIFPASLRGFMIAAFAAAYMSTIGTQLNWGASYVINDFYRRFLVRDASERHFVIASQVVTVLLMVISIVVTRYLESISGAWQLLMVTGAGTGTVLLLRWYWWRINAWSEVSAMITAAVVSLFLQVHYGMESDSNKNPYQFAYLMLITVGITTVVWLLVTMLTPAEPQEKLVEFYRRVRPAGPGWSPIAAVAGTAEGAKREPRTPVLQLVPGMHSDLCHFVWYRQTDIQGLWPGGSVLGGGDSERRADVRELVEGGMAGG